MSTIETVLECTDLDAMSTFFSERLGFRIETISPADDPVEIAMAAASGRVRLRRGTVDTASRLRLATADRPAGAATVELVAPNGTVIELVSSSLDVVVPQNAPSLTFTKHTAADAFGTGRAGMGYRDLLPDRWGGRFIASHILIAEGGDVADYVHFHRIRFQMIFVAAGWVDVVYEDQGEPFRMEAGDCVLQPPEIRHRVLRSSPGLEVIEIGCPAQHDTVAEHEITLPTAVVLPDRDFGGQRFVRHVAAGAVTSPSVIDGCVVRDTGIGAATSGLAGAVVYNVGTGVRGGNMLTHNGEFVMGVALAGTADLLIDGREPEPLGQRDAVALPGGTRWSWANLSDDFELLEVTLPAATVVRV